jgi:hypothetical protein
VLYKYKGKPFDTSNWDPTFGPPPTEVTAMIMVADPFPEDRNFIGGSVGSPYGGRSDRIISASISDGVRTVTPDTVFLEGYGNTIREWIIEGGFLIQPGPSGSRAISTCRITSNAEQFGAGDCAVFQQAAGAGRTPYVIEASVRTHAWGEWIAVNSAAGMISD